MKWPHFEIITVKPTYSPKHYCLFSTCDHLSIRVSDRRLRPLIPLNDFSSETSGPIFFILDAKLSVNGGLRICSNGHGLLIKMAAMPVHGNKTPLRTLLQNQASFKDEYWYIASGTQGLPSLFKWWFVQMMTLGWHLTFLRQAQICILWLVWGNLEKSVSQDVLKTNGCNLQCMIKAANPFSNNQYCTPHPPPPPPTHTHTQFSSPSYQISYWAVCRRAIINLFNDPASIKMAAMHIYVKALKTLLLQNQKSFKAKSWYISSGTIGLPNLTLGGHLTFLRQGQICIFMEKILKSQFLKTYERLLAETQCLSK